MKLTIRQLIEQLELLDRQRNSGAHPTFDKVSFELEFTDPELDRHCWEAELTEVNNWG